MQVECDVDNAYAIRRLAQRLMSPELQDPTIDPFPVEATKTTEHCPSVVLGRSREIGDALRGVGTAVDGLEVIGQYIQLDQVRANAFEAD